MTDSRPIVDQSARDAAVVERARNVLIDAGAGTGKTKTLVSRLVNLIAPGSGGGLAIDRIAAVTFTRRAAGELRLRVREDILGRLSRLDVERPVRRRLEEALSGVDTAYIGTIHSFADRLLRTRPIAAQLSPSYEVVEDDELLIQETYHLLHQSIEHGSLDRALAGTAAAPLAAEAQRTVAESLRAGIRAVTQETDHYSRFGLDALVTDFIRHRSTPPQVPASPTTDLRKLEPYMREFSSLAVSLPGRSRFRQWMVDTSRRMDRLIGETDPAVLFAEMAIPLDAKRRTSGRPNKRDDCDGDPAVWRAWKILHEGGAHREGRDIPLGDDLTKGLNLWLSRRLVRLFPVVITLYERVKASHGVVDQVDLLLRLRDLMRDDTTTRALLQARFDHVLVDEFQDTDPLQAEILLFLCERAPIARTWQDIEVAPGRLTLVGDPKQSIYRFRRADIAMYEDVRRKAAPGALQVSLRTGFRSTPALTSWINDRFGRVLGRSTADAAFDPEEGQVYYRDLAAKRPNEAGASVHVLPFELAEEEGTSADAYRALEAEALPHYLRWLVERSGFTFRPDDRTEPRPVRFGDVCVLAVTTTQVPLLLRGLDRLGIPHASAGGSLFLLDPLHRQFILGLRALADPDDGIAEAALLRPPFFALDLDDLVLASAGGIPGSPRVTAARERIRDMRRSRLGDPPGVVARRLLDETGFARWLARTPNGAQRLRNLRELCHLLELQAAEEALDFDAATERLRRWIDDPGPVDAPRPVEGEVVQVLTVHQAKGLEFPVVVLWDGRAPLASWTTTKPPWRLTPDGRRWEVGLHGLSGSEPPGIDLGEQEKKYRNHERRRILYVAATRARDLLVVPRAGTVDPKTLCGALLDGPQMPGTVELEPFRRDRHPRWVTEQAGEKPAARAALELHSELTDLWQAAVREATAPRLRPVAVSAGSTAGLLDPGEDRVISTSRTGRYGPAFGTLVHQAIARAIQQSTASVEEAIDWALSSSDQELAPLRPHAVQDVQRTVDVLNREGLLDRTAISGIRLEYPLAGRGSGGAMLIGFIDLVVTRDDNVYVIDFKTDEPPPAGVLNSYPKYARQVGVYAELLTASGQFKNRQVRPGLLFSADGSLHWL